MGKRDMGLLRMGRSVSSSPSAYYDSDVLYLPARLAEALERYSEERALVDDDHQMTEEDLQSLNQYLNEIHDSDPIRQISGIPRLGRHARSTDEVEKNEHERALPRLGLKQALAKLAARTAPLPRIGYRETMLEEEERALPRLGLREEVDFQRALPRLGLREKLPRIGYRDEEEVERALPRLGVREDIYTGRAVPLPRLGLKSIERAVPLPRLGVRDLENQVDKKAMGMLRMGRSDGSEPDEEETVKRGVSMLRMGKKAMGMLRMGRSDGSEEDVEKRAMGMS